MSTRVPLHVEASTHLEAATLQPADVRKSNTRPTAPFSLRQCPSPTVATVRSSASDFGTLLIALSAAVSGFTRVP
eukprot:3788437-Alexandrium_andersonii.AAC.1